MFDRVSRMLGYAGLLPFVVLSLLFSLLGGDAQQRAGLALVAYGAVIVSFLGACHWGILLVGGYRDYLLPRAHYAVVPALVAWIALLLPLAWGLAVLIGGLIMTYLVDRRWYSGYPRYLVLRRRLTLVALASLALPLGLLQ